MPSIKEPHYFVTEWGARRGVETVEEYERLFKPAGDGQIRGEASVGYLSFPSSIEAIVQRRPDVKIIAQVRNPIDLFVSWHNSCLKTLDEDISDPEQAWRMQEQRFQGHALPPDCYERILEYRKICSFGAQIKRLFELVPPSQRLVLVVEDIQKRPGDVYQELLRFLEVRDDGRRGIIRTNEFAQPRNLAIARLSRSINHHPILKKIRIRLKPALNRRGIHIIERTLRRGFTAPVSRPQLTSAFRRTLCEEFRTDVSLLSKLLDRDLLYWLSERGSEEKSLAAPVVG